MVCENCGLAKRIKMGGRVILSPMVPFLFTRLEEALSSVTKSFETEHQTFSIEIDNFNAFIVALQGAAAFNKAEADAIQVIHLLEGEVMGPGVLSKMQTLNRWLSLTQSSLIMDVLEKESLVIHFHQIMDLRKNEVYGYECLVRGVHEDGSLIPPAILFSQAKTTGLMFNLDRLAREFALKTAAKAGIKNHLFINFVPTSIYNPEHCLQTTVGWVDKLGLSPRQIVFEVVETEKVEDHKHLTRILDYYRDIGFRIALDDVGAGYAGLLNLIQLGPDLMKIDREIISDIHKTPFKQSIFSALQNIAEENEITLLAEGIETDEELAWIKARGVALGQGWVFGKPGPVPVGLS